MDPFPGSANPKASIKQFIELAVNIPEQEPQVGHAKSSNSFSFSALIDPVLNCPTPSKTDIRSIFSPSGVRPDFIGPPETNIVGILTLTAPISCREPIYHH